VIALIVLTTGVNVQFKSYTELAFLTLSGQDKLQLMKALAHGDIDVPLTLQLIVNEVNQSLGNQDVGLILNHSESVIPAEGVTATLSLISMSHCWILLSNIDLSIA
jgi:hypothetical protein